MKPLHIGLLMVGAAVAGGLAVKMTAPPAFPPPRATTATQPKAAAEAQTPTPAPEPAAAAVMAPKPYVPPARPVKTVEAATSAPPPVYTAPKHASTKRTPFPSANPQPVQIAQAQPAQLPGLYQKQPESPSPAIPAGPSPQAAAVQPVSQKIEPQPAEDPEPPRQVTLEPGMTLTVRTLETLSSDRVSAGDTFSATLAEPLVINGLVIAERGARVDGRIISAQRAARMNGRSEIGLALSHIMTADGQRIAISTDPWSKTGSGSGMTQAEKIGSGAALGAVIGAIAGGGTGAAIGAAIGSGAGVGAAVATRAKPVTVPTESVIRFRVTSRITITERRL